ncbi:MAG: DUF1566 domain-containing protein [Thiothrix sp.]
MREKAKCVGLFISVILLGSSCVPGEYVPELKVVQLTAPPAGLMIPEEQTEQAGPVGKLNDTGITLCADDAVQGSYNHDVHCSLLTDMEGDPVPPGQDALSGRDTIFNDDSDGHAGFSFTKLGVNGLALSIQDQTWDNNGSEPLGSRWSCVKDNVTGLVWEITQSADNTYLSSQLGERVQKANHAGWCGATDWRLPTMQELRSIMDFSYRDPAIDTSYFPDTNGEYWSAMPEKHDDDGLIIKGSGSVNFREGNSGKVSSDTISLKSVRLVYGPLLGAGAGLDKLAGVQCTNENITPTTPAHHFIFHPDGTVAHTPSGLMWKRCLEGQVFTDNNTPDDPQDDQCVGYATDNMPWAVALNHVQTLDAQGGFAGYADWRIPNIKELESIVEFCRSDPAFNTAVFPDSAYSLWSSSPVMNDAEPYWVWVLHFRFGVVTQALQGDINNKAIRLVRTME